MRRIGDFAQADFFTMRLAEELQALSMQYIQEAYFAEEELNLDNLTFANFVKAADAAQEGGPIAQKEFDRLLAKIIKGATDQVLNPPQKGSNQ